MLIFPKIIDQLKAHRRKAHNDEYVIRKELDKFINIIETKYQIFDFEDIDIRRINELMLDAEECWKNGLLKFPFESCAFQVKLLNDNEPFNSVIFITEAASDIFKALHIFEHVAEVPFFEFEINNTGGATLNIFPHMAKGGIEYAESVLAGTDMQQHVDHICRVVIGFAMLLNTRGVSTELQEPNREQNRLRRSRGKAIIPAYNIVKITPIKAHGVTAGLSSGTPKRTHYRRGHIREYKSGKITWVRPMIINANYDDPIPPGHYEVKL